jgi:hypothetical protein
MSLRISVVLVLFFFLPAAFSYPGRAYYWLTKLRAGEIVSAFHVLLLPTIILSILLLIIRSQKKFHINKSEVGILSVLILWTLAATLSFIFNFSIEDVQINYISAYFSSFLVYLALKNFPLTKNQINLIFLALSLGSLFPLISGLIAYYHQWGIPNASTLILSFYSLPTMTEYHQATFGNVGNTAAFLTLISPPLFMLSIDKKRSLILRSWFWICLLLVILNWLIIQSRTAFFVLFIAALFVLYFKSPKKSILIIIALIFGLEVFKTSGIFNFFSERLSVAIKLDRQGDNSVDERLAAMQQGWNIFLNNWEVGVGPGASQYYNSFSTAHQFIVQQGAELGVLGLLASSLIVIIVFYRLFKILVIGSSNALNKERFIFIIGPASYLLYGMLANMALNIGVVNTWIVLMAALLALVDFKPKPNQRDEVSVNLNSL